MAQSAAGSPAPGTQTGFSAQQKFVIVTLTFLQFTVILDFMILSPLGAMLMPGLKISPQQFGFVVSAYAFSAGASGILAGGFADRFDRKRLLMLFYAGFLLGTLCCGLATSYEFLFVARIITGLFGGVIGSTIFAITADLFPMEVRGRVMGFLQTAFAASLVLGIPIGLFFANHWGWHSPFFMIVAIGSCAGLIIALRLQPIREHLNLERSGNPFQHLATTLTAKKYLKAFAATALMTTGGFMLMPFTSAFCVHNLGVPLAKLPIIYLVTGVFAIITGPGIGRAVDAFGSFRTFAVGTVISLAVVLIYTNLGLTPLAGVVLINVIVSVGGSARMISSQALMSAVPAPQSRGSFMAVNSSLQQMAGGVASVIAGHIVIEGAKPRLRREP